MIAITQSNDNEISVAILSNGKTVKATHSSLMRIFNLWTSKFLRSVYRGHTQLVLVTILVREEN